MVDGQCLMAVWPPHLETLLELIIDLITNTFIHKNASVY